MGNNKKNKSLVPLFFIIAVLVIGYFCPREGEFIYSYEEGKPWKYGLLTAAFDFPIDKPKLQLEREQDSLMQTYKPYYKIDEAVEDSIFTQFEAFAKAQSIPIEYVQYVQAKLKSVFKKGIISVEDYDKVSKTKAQQLMLFDVGNVFVSRPITSFFTARSAYQEIIKDRPSSLDLQVLSSLDINNFLYLGNNIVYDAETSAKAREDLLRQVYPAQGMVQSGQKIIDRGEIVTHVTYNILESLKRVTLENSDSKTHKNWIIVGQIILIGIYMFSLMIYLILFRPKEYENLKNTIFMLLLTTFFCVLTGITVNFSLFSVYIIPYVIPTIMIRTFIDSRTAMLTHLVMILICSLMVPFPMEFIILQMSAGLICIFSLKDLSERSQLMKCAFYVFIGYFLAYVGYVLSEDGVIILKEDFSLDQTKHYWLTILYFVINCMFVMFSYLLVYMSERTFGFISNVSMIELSNINKPLLQELSQVAPGTFQHSIQVSNLANAVAQKIGANASLVRTGALYHDIGKMTNPIFFTENQAAGMNPHSGLSYKESAKIIISHVEEGIKIAHKYNLPQQIIDFIATHHGEGKAKFFYNSYKNEHPDEHVDPKDFSYPGPNPFTKETAILMMADTVEAASRSLPQYTEESISALVNKLIDDQIQSGLLRNAPITFKEIDVSKSILIERLMMIYHTRITYPELHEDAKSS